MVLHKYILLALFLFTAGNMQSQEVTNDWVGYFSYLDIKDISQNEDKIYAAAENAVFIYDINTKEIEKLSTINGLSGESISTIHYSANYELLLIGYENGLIEVVLDNDDDILTIVDVLNKPTVSPGNKRINHFNEVNDIAYISTNYGISEYSLSDLEFGDTFFIGNGGAQRKVQQTTIFNDYIYASTLEQGVFKAELANPNLIDYQQWESIIGSLNWLGVQSLGDRLYTIQRNKRLYEIVNDNPVLLQVFQDIPVDLRSNNNKLLVTTEKEVFIYNSDFVQIFNSTINSEFDSDFTCSTITSNDDVFIGTIGSVFAGKPGYGILETTLSNPLEYQSIHPECPLLNDLFSIEVQANQLWAVFGRYAFFNWVGGNRKTGISHLKNEQWINTPYDSLEAVIPRPQFLSDISVNPVNTDEVFVSSFLAGLIQTDQDQPVTLFTQDNSTLLPFVGELYLITDSKYDDNGVLWTLDSRVDQALNKYENDQWTSYDLSGVVTSATGNLGYSEIEFANDGSIFIASYAYGIVGLTIEGSTITAMNNVASEEQNMPSAYVTTLATDNSNAIWIGTTKGLRVLYNASSFFTSPNPAVNEIIILEEGVPQELLFQQYITDIKVDGSNNKWVSTLDSGLFYFSSDGQETIHHFTKDNSPLPTNNITDLAIDSSNGTIYIATNKGLLSFKSGGSAALESLENAFVYPNPVRPTFNIADDKVKIKDISNNVNIKITDIEGNLVAEAETRTNSRYKGYNLEIDGGTAFWNGKNLANNIVASGVYLVMLSDLDTFETKVLKIMVVR